MKVIKLSAYAIENGVTYRTAWNRFKKGKIKNAYQDELGNVLIKIEEKTKYELSNICIYARVSNHSAKENLVRQVERLADYSIRNGFKIVKTVSEIGSGVNDSRKQLIKVLQDDSWGTLIVENKDRLTRFGFNYFKVLLEKQGKNLLVVNESKDDISDIVQDLVSIVYSFSDKLYGKGNNKTKVKNIVDSIIELEK